MPYNMFPLYKNGMCLSGLFEESGQQSYFQSLLRATRSLYIDSYYSPGIIYALTPVCLTYVALRV